MYIHAYPYTHMSTHLHACIPIYAHTLVLIEPAKPAPITQTRQCSVGAAAEDVGAGVSFKWPRSIWRFGCANSIIPLTARYIK